LKYWAIFLSFLLFFVFPLSFLLISFRYSLIGQCLKESQEVYAFLMISRPWYSSSEIFFC
jgi:hypothetical protein